MKDIWFKIDLWAAWLAGATGFFTIARVFGDWKSWNLLAVGDVCRHNAASVRLG